MSKTPKHSRIFNHCSPFHLENAPFDGPLDSEPQGLCRSGILSLPPASKKFTPEYVGVSAERKQDGSVCYKEEGQCVAQHTR